MFRIFPIFISHIGCPFKCIYCNQFLASSQSVVAMSPSSIDLTTITNFIKKHKDKPKEIGFFGGSFTCLSQSEMQAYFDQISPLIDNQTTFRLSTRPDAITPEILDFLWQNKVRTIELGVQSFDDNELQATQRGYTAQTAIKACELVKEWGFKLCVQLLIGLPTTQNPKRIDTASCVSTLISIKPDYVRLYPLLVLKDTHLETLYKEGRYTPLTIDEAVSICQAYLKACEQHGIKVIKIGLHSDISKDDVIAGPYHPNFGEMVRGKR